MRNLREWIGCKSNDYTYAQHHANISSGNILIIGSTTAIIIGLTWGGVTHPWVSKQVLTPLIIGIVAMCAFFVYEAKIPSEPLVRVFLCY